jgi:hypothetical protein
MATDHPQCSGVHTLVAVASAQKAVCVAAQPGKEVSYGWLL